ncbi:helix-turn-helix domain-containing protein [Sulfitobacter sp. S223]|uniref:helix-turn-helix domain-containing protein n=1 Tax=Sulfitobacter sp. S223 TaxID=2867023 RepID=UPI0021A34BCE|nr:AraC family transcriptional regulator [Sulfitobacter sp. S223]UWR25864.1 helix-turn-helix domain-containing protein [Sulfitobacter sp. S223]
MPSLPIPMISALILSCLLLRLLIVDKRHGPLAMLLALCALQGLIISLAQHFQVSWARPLQPVTASLIPPMAWVAFQTTAVRKPNARDAVHLIGPFCVVAALLIQPQPLDFLIPAVFAGYGLAIVWQSRKGADALPRMRLEAGDMPGLVWQIIGWALIASALSDGLIVLVQIIGMGYLQPWIISIASSTTLAVIGVLTLSGALGAGAPDPEEAAAPREADALDTQIMTQLDALMAQAQPYLNPDLTMSQLSRRLRVPVKQLSGAINRVTGDNVSRYINAARIAAAQNSLLSGENVTAAMLGAGFNTKSNFNREFLRVAGASPSDWLAQQRA